MLKFLKEIWAEFRTGTAPIQAKWIVGLCVLSFLVFGFLFGGVILTLVTKFISVKVVEAKVGHVLVLMVIGFFMFGRNSES